MKFVCVLGLLLLSAATLAKEPIDVVNERIDAHNKYDLDRFLATYADEVKVYDYPNVQLGSGGKERLRKIFGPLFNDKSVQTTVHSQMTTMWSIEKPWLEKENHRNTFSYTK
ncbi:hypothetical protein [Teredinibacter sp. KSP-S5-2]|uniref:hypothetical protein n=1 Tax=Teredinibacter sp. KSP-S5-2 TaxID=3034506 RepID=UPI0029345251|nr:hypothetical protein [Teredinibacter sp. KSP-S5-2]WNO09410.1 hypothetical protein P5V12_20935 [Teredinibacter sp. KSP-S5-2]